CKSERVVKKSPAYVDFVGSELEDDTETCFQQIQVLTLALHGQKWVRGQRDIECRARNDVPTNIESYSDWSCWKNRDPSTIVNGEFFTKFSKGRKAILGSPQKYCAQTCRYVGRDLRQRGLQKNIAVVNDCFGIRRKKIRRVRNRVFTTDDPA